MNTLRPYSLSLKQRWGLLLILLGFTVFFASISFVNHFLFRTFGWDLAYFSKAIFDYSEFRLNAYDIWWTDLKYTLGDHFEPIMFLIAPLRYIFGQYTLLVVQMAAVLFGGYGAFVLVRHRTEATWMPHLAMIHYLSIWGIYSALAFDYHNNVVGAMFLPWVVHYFSLGKLRASFIFFLLLLMTKENMALWGLFIGLGLMLHFRRERRMAIAGAAFAGFAALYFVFAMKVVLPAFQPEGVDYQHFRYSVLGEGFGDAIKTILTRPLYALRMMYTNHMEDSPHLDGVKMELYRMIFLSGGFVLLFRPKYLLMALPIIGQKVFSDKAGAWGINSHYSIELVPIISLAVFGWLVRIRIQPLQYLLAFLVTLMTLGSTIYSFPNRLTPFYKSANLNLFDPMHWKRDEFSIVNMRRAIEMVPDGVPVSATNTILPHLSMRDKAYMFPRRDDAEYVLVLRQVDAYPAPPDKLEAEVNEMQASGEWETLMDDGMIILMKRLPGTMP